jgi:DeoR family fructose operon transcriptional repressor
MFSEARKVEIRSLLTQKGSIEVNVLAELFNTSRETIRRDLCDLERQGALKRTHGGAILEMSASMPPPESPVGERGMRQREEKKLICRTAAGFIQNGDTLFIDNSSTMIYLPRYIPRDITITIITNSIGLLYEISRVNSGNWLSICLGGVFKPRNLSVHGSDTLKNVEPYYPSKTFVSCTGISPLNQFADSSPQEVELKRIMIDRAQTAYMLADHTKFEKTGQVFLCDFSSIDCLITDPEFSQLESGQEILVQNNIDLVIASGNDRGRMDESSSL